MNRTQLWAGLLVLLLCAGTVWGAPQETAGAAVAQAPGSRLITYSGTLIDAEGRARAGSVGLTFSLYALQEGGEPLWRERQTVAADESGRYSVLLGATVPGGVLPEAFGDGKAQWLGVAVEGEAEQPRVLLVAVPYALKAADADTLGGKPIASFVLSSDLEKAVEQQVASVPTTGTGGVAVVSTGTIGTLGNEVGGGTWYGEFSGTGGYCNSFFGQWAGYFNTGEFNAFFGQYAGGSNSTGSYNAFFGRGSGSYNSTGQYNTAIGFDSGGFNTVENNNTFLGAYARGSAGITNATAIGYRAAVAQSNSLVLGSIAGVNDSYEGTSVGIGTTQPQAMLHVAGNVKFGDNMGGVNNIIMGSGVALPTWSGNVELNNESGVGFHFRALTTKFDIGPGSGGAPTYPGLLTLSMDGKVGIGTTSPAYKLHVAGDIYTTGTYQGSDLRLKDHVQDLGYGVQEVLRLRPVSYRWKDSTPGNQTLGLIAQEVQPVLPELVAHGTDEAGLLSLNYTGLIPVLVKAVQEQEAKIDEQHSALAKKDAEIAALHARLAALEERMQQLLRQEK